LPRHGGPPHSGNHLGIDVGLGAVKFTHFLPPGWSDSGVIVPGLFAPAGKSFTDHHPGIVVAGDFPELDVVFLNKPVRQSPCRERSTMPYPGRTGPGTLSPATFRFKPGSAAIPAASIPALCRTSGRVRPLMAQVLENCCRFVPEKSTGTPRYASGWNSIPNQSLQSTRIAKPIGRRPPLGPEFSWETPTTIPESISLPAPRLRVDLSTSSN
jgi:hypothetical protein